MKLRRKEKEMVKKCCACGMEIEDNSEEAIIDMPFAGGFVSFCSEKCKEEDTKGLN